MTARHPAASIMHQVALALVPGILAMTWFFGIGIAVNLVICCAACLATEALILRLRAKPLTSLADGSALLTGLLLGLCLPPLVPLWIPTLGGVFAIALGKQLYGGLGHNPFNPAMVGYAALIVAFPLSMSLWPAPDTMPAPGSTLSLKLIGSSFDGFTAATPLDAFKFRGAMTVAEFEATHDHWSSGWPWINLGFLTGGLYLWYRKLCDRIMPMVLIATIILITLLGYDSGSSASLGSPLFHLLAGSTMLTAFFIITDPVSSPDGIQGRVIYAAGIGMLIMVIRELGAYPDGTAFAVLLMNTATPLLDQLRWRTA